MAQFRPSTQYRTLAERDQELLEQEAQAKARGFRLTEPFNIKVLVQGSNITYEPVFENGNPDINEADLRLISAHVLRALSPFMHEKADERLCERIRYSITEEFREYRIPFRGVQVDFRPIEQSSFWDRRARGMCWASA